jgi:CDP-glucose 4,6-dehydratase
MDAVVNGSTDTTPRFAPTEAFWRGKRVFLTGHTGFKGSWLTLWLSELGAKVRGYALAPDTEPSMFAALALDDLCDSRIGDVRDERPLVDAVRDFRPHVLIHMAAQPLVRRSYRQPLDTFAINVQGTANVLEACRSVDQLRAVVVVTTDKCYENHEELRPYREDEPLGGHDPYSASKACAELVTHSYRHSFFAAAGSPAIASARAGNVFGGGDWSEDRLIPDMVRAYSGGRPVVVRNPVAVRPWQHVTAPLGGYLMLARALWEENERFALPFNFGPSVDQASPVRTIVETMSRAWGKGAAWEERPEANAPHEAAILLLDPNRARQMLGWTPHDDLHAGLAATAAWYRSFYDGAPAERLRHLTLQQIADLAPIGPQGLREREPTR